LWSIRLWLSLRSPQWKLTSPSLPFPGLRFSPPSPLPPKLSPPQLLASPPLSLTGQPLLLISLRRSLPILPSFPTLRLSPHSPRPSQVIPRLSLTN
jgi:hypothetical protein